MKRIVLFAGSFNPPTIAHLSLAKEVVKNLSDIEYVVFSPVNDGYRKKGLINGIHRLQMTKLLVEGEKNLIVSDDEVKSSEYINTYNSLKIIQSKYPDREILLLMGSDKLGQLRKWKNIRQLLGDFKILLCSRDKAEKMELLDEYPTFHEFKNRFEILSDIKEINISSTMIRNNLKENKSIEGLTKKSIFQYIKENKLYI